MMDYCTIKRDKDNIEIKGMITPNLTLHETDLYFSKHTKAMLTYEDQNIFKMLQPGIIKAIKDLYKP